MFGGGGRYTAPFKSRGMSALRLAPLTQLIRFSELPSRSLRSNKPGWQKRGRNCKPPQQNSRGSNDADRKIHGSEKPLLLDYSVRQFRRGEPVSSPAVSSTAAERQGSFHRRLPQPSPSTGAGLPWGGDRLGSTLILGSVVGVKMSDNLMDKVSAFGERLKITGTEVSKKMTAGMSSMSFKMKELFQGQTPADKIVEDATSENLDGPDWNSNLEICDLINTEKVNSVELIRGIKKRIMLKDARVQYLSLVLLETIVKNCEKAFSEVAAERVLDEMVRLIDDPQTVVNNRNKALMLIEAWGESGDELRYLPVYEETYKSLKSRGVRFPGRDNESLAPIFTPPRSVAEADVDASLPQQAFEDVHVHTYTAEETKEAFDVARNSIELLSTVLSSSPEQDALQDDLTATLVQQCYQSQHTIQRIIETVGDNEAVLFEALSVNDEIQKVLSKYEEMKQPRASEHAEQRPVVIPIATEHEDSTAASNEDALVRKPAAARARSGGDDDILDDLDEMIFGKKGGSSSSQEGPKKPDPKKDDLISF